MKTDLKYLEITRDQRKELIGDEDLFSRAESGSFTSVSEFRLRFMGFIFAIVGVLLPLSFFLGVELGPDQLGAILAGAVCFFSA